MKSSDCHIEKDIDDAIETGKEFAKSIKKLKSSIKKCSDCELFDDCKMITIFQASVQSIIETVNEEWNIPI